MVGKTSSAGRLWTEQELLGALALYCQLPFGKMHARNPAVVALAAQIGRTPSAVALKLVNFASLDPELRNRGVGGMGNVSRADRRIFSRFYGNWDKLAEHAIVEVPPHERPESRPAPKAPTPPADNATEVVRETAARRGQSFFRAAVLAAYGGRCCITGISCPDLLRASHIVPWSHDPVLRLDPHNGLCLNALHDAAFDRGFITLSDRFELRASETLRDEMPSHIYNGMIEAYLGKPVTMPERYRPTAEVLEYHRRKVFHAR